MKKDIVDFSLYLKVQRNYSSYTITNYLKDILDYQNYLVNNNLNYKDVKRKDITNYLIEFEERGYKSSSISRKLSSIRSFYDYLLRNNIINNNPFKIIKSPKKDKLLPKFLYTEEIEELLNISNLTKPLGQRDQVIVETLYSTGIRVSELINIKIDDIDFNNRTIRVLGKGNKERIVYYGDYLDDILKIYINDGRRSLLVNKTSKYLILNNRGDILTTRGVRMIIDNMIKKTSIKKKISPHVLRHTFATIMLNDGADIRSVQTLLGHENLSATEIYTHVTNDRIKDVYLKSHPRARLKDK